MQEMGQVNEQQVVSRNPDVESQMTVGGWIITFILLAIPFINFIMLFVWGFGATNPRRNFARAQLIMIGIMIVLSIVSVIVIAILGMSSGIFSNFS